MTVTFDTAEPIIASILGSGADTRSRLRQKLDALDVPGYTTDADGFITYFNQACVEYVGRNPEIGRDRWQVAWKLYTAEGDYLPHDYSPMAAAIKSRRPVRGISVLAARPGGTRVHFAPFPTPLYDDAGKFVGTINILIDIVHVPRISDLQRQAERCRRLRFSSVDGNVQAVLGQIAAAYETKIGELTRVPRDPTAPRTLGDVLYPNSKSVEPESE